MDICAKKTLKQRLGIVMLFLVTAFHLNAQNTQQNASEILNHIKKLNVLGNVLYLAAHPDDENTRLIAYFSNEALVNTAYLAATRGDGGQNLIGPELREGLGVIRTQELLAARRIDGGQQFFTRANDFGYSKTSEETLKIWNKQEVLSDMVWVIRKFRPDVIITRFPPDKRAGHGHHATSAILAEEAFKLAGDKKAYPEQLKYVEPWRPTRLLINSGRWWDKDIEKQPNTIKIDVGTYNSLLGISYTEMAATSRSQHKSQGFGATHFRGSQLEYLKPVLGKPAKNTVFDDIDISWNRVGHPEITAQVHNIVDEFEEDNPYASIPALISLKKQVAKVKDDFWRSKKVAEIDELIKSCAGLFVEATATQPNIVPGDSLIVHLELVNRSSSVISLKKAVLDHHDEVLKPIALENNDKKSLTFAVKTNRDTPFTAPYWLREPASLGMYKVSDQLLRGTPENKAAYYVKTDFIIDGDEISYAIPVMYKWTDRVEGEKYRPLNVVPALVGGFDNPVNIFKNGAAKKISVTLTANHSISNGSVALKLPKGWSATPALFSLESLRAGKAKQVEFLVRPPKNGTGVQSIGLQLQADGATSNLSMQTIAYSHIPYQVLLPKAESKSVALQISVDAKTVGYIMGAGDAVPAALEQLGIKVWLMSEQDITADNLQNLDAVILGIRAINTQPWLSNKKDELLNYVKDGGTIITQYNTTRRLDWHDFAPYELKFTGRSADSRVAEENAKVIILNKAAPELSYPNKITAQDFEGWVQERGLYFPASWDSNFKPSLVMQDTGEPIHKGSLLVAEYGKGHYVYTGLSFFRELPAGVPGAYRLFANLLSLPTQPSSTVKPK